MKIVLILAVAAVLLVVIEVGQRRIRRGARDRRSGEARHPMWVAPWVQRGWPYLIPGGLLLFGVAWWAHLPSTGLSIYTFAIVLFVIGIRGAIYERTQRNR